MRMVEKRISIGMVGAGRATELHMQAYSYVRGIFLRYKTIMAKRVEHAELGKQRYRFECVAENFDEMLQDEEIDVIDICTPPYVHADMIEQSLRAGKYVICEKPLTGYFGETGDLEPIGINVSKQKMYEKVIEKMDSLRAVITEYPNKFMYAENFIYAPSIQKMAEIILKKKSRILCMRGEESLKGSSSHVAGEWSKTGGGTFIRTGSHPLSAVLWLKQIEARAYGSDIEVESVIADMGCITKNLNAYDHRHILARPNDVEDFGTAVITFSDKTKAVITATDTLLGGSRNYVEAYCNDAVLYSNLTLNDNLQTYFLDEDRLEEVYISEMLPSKLGWNKTFIADEIMRGYVAEIQDFMECIVYHREPVSGFKLAYDTTKLIYASYLSAENEQKVCFK